MLMLLVTIGGWSCIFSKLFIAPFVYVFVQTINGDCVCGVVCCVWVRSCRFTIAWGLLIKSLHCLRTLIRQRIPSHFFHYIHFIIFARYVTTHTVNSFCLSCGDNKYTLSILKMNYGPSFINKTYGAQLFSVLFVVVICYRFASLFHFCIYLRGC